MGQLGLWLAVLDKELVDQVQAGLDMEQIGQVQDTVQIDQDRVQAGLDKELTGW